MIDAERAAVWIYICKNDTEPECFARSLFGDAQHHPTKKGDLTFLLNIETGELYGVFEVLTDIGTYQRDAWITKRRGGFPYQIKVKPIGRIICIRGRRVGNNKFEFSYRNIVVRIGGYCQQLDPQTAGKLLDIFGKIIRDKFVFDIGKSNNIRFYY